MLNANDGGRGPLVLLVVLLGGCAGAEAGPGPVVAPPRRDRAAIDLDGQSCRGFAEGSLRSRGGMLWFSPGGLRPSVLLPGISGRFSRFLPQLASSLAFAVRGGAKGAGDALVKLDPTRLAPSLWWSGAAPLRLLGRAGHRAVLLSHEANTTRVLAIDGQGRAVRSPPIAVPEALWREDRMEAGMPLSAPLGPGGWLLICGDRLCRVQLYEERIEVTPLSLRAEALGLWEGRLLIRQPGGRCIEPGQRPIARWTRLRPRRCPEDLRASFAPALPEGLSVDGALAGDARLRVPACLVRGEIELPDSGYDLKAIDGAAPPTSAGAGLVPLSLQLSGEEISLSLLVRGRRFAVGLSGEAATEAPGLVDHFQLALPAGAARARKRPEPGLFELQIRVTLPFTPENCIQGLLQMDATAGESTARLSRPYRSSGCREP